MAKTTAKNFFSDAEKRRVEAAVKEAEARTSGEIVPMIVDESYDYPRAEILGGGLFALATAIVLSWAFGHESIWVFLPLFIGLYFVFKHLIRRTPALKRRLIPEAEISGEVEEKALVAFIDQGLHHTRDETGILILISLLEHRVFVLADRGINDQVPPHTWDELIGPITLGIKQGQACDALCAAIKRCGDLLEEKFPVSPDDTNELPNLIIE